MDFKEKVRKNLAAIKKLLLEDQPPADPTKGTPGALADGTALVITPALEVGAVIAKVDDTGNPGEVLKDGDYTMDNGATVTIAEGKISVVGENPDVMAGLAEVLPKIGESLSAIQKTLLAAEERFKASDEKLVALAAENATLKLSIEAGDAQRKVDMAEQKKFHTDLAGLITKITDDPAAPPVKKPATFGTTAKNPAKDRVNELVQNHLKTIEQKN